ncbi:MAG TPA: diadenylate cyclase [Phycisphaerae bacterium]|jgi:diadenylate cyclase|nr:diadenylate cyclase [Phycisphaerae bacterium]
MAGDASQIVRRDELAAPVTLVSIERRIRDALIRTLPQLIQECGAAAALVYAEALDAQELELPPEIASRLLYVTKTRRQEEQHEERGHRILRVPNVRLSRMGQAQVAILLAVSRKLIEPDEVVVVLTGMPGGSSLDTLLVLHVRSELDMPLDAATESDLSRDVRPDVLERVLNIAAELGYEGREGKMVGGLFVVGDSQNVLALSRQLILNPFKGYSEEARNILAPELKETVKELSSIDGAFIIRGDGVIEAAGAYLTASTRDIHDLPAGLGARHQAAAGITAVTNAVAIAVSQSTGHVTVFRRGHIIADLEKPRTRTEPGEGD